MYRVDLGDGTTQGILGSGRDTQRMILNERGEPIARIDVDDQRNRWRLYAIAGTQTRLIMEDVSDAGLPLSVSGAMSDGRLAGVDRLRRGGDKAVLFAVDMSGAISTLRQSDRYDVDRPIFDPWTHLIVGASIVEDFDKQHFIDRRLSEAHQRLAELDPTAIVRLESWSRDRSKFLVYVERVSDAGGYYVFEPATNDLRLIAMRYPQLAGPAIGARQAIMYPARDGVRIPAYLTLPFGAAPRNLPLVVLVHGGPTSRDTFDFNWWASFIASRGYAVVQPNFRGSGGYGDAWERAGYRQWGQLMQTDVEDAAAALARNGIADPARICIIGGSYGGYAALAGAVLTPDRYRCAVAVAGVSDLPMMLANVETRTGDESIASDWWRMLIGDRADDRNKLREISPAYRAENARAPILLIHGANDIVVPIAQSRRMERALRGAGRSVRLVEFPGEDHWLSDAPTRIQTLREIETFLAENLPR